MIARAKSNETSAAEGRELKAGRTSQVASGAGVLAAVFAALCCAGIPVIVGALSAVGLSFLRQDAILLPLLIVSLLIAIWGLAKGQPLHGSVWPLILGSAGGIALIAAITVFRPLLWPGAALILIAMIWNIAARRPRLV